MDSGWSIKSMHRLMMNSRVYQLDSKVAGTLRRADSPRDADDQHRDSADGTRSVPATLRTDPDNRLHWRFHRRRLDAESLRDTLLLLSGELDMSMMKEPHPFPPVDKWEFTQHHPFRDSYESNRRSVYLMTARLNARPFFTTFDGADRNASTATRGNSVTTVQSLFLLNNDFVHQRADHFATRLMKESSLRADRLKLTFELTIGRPPIPDEQAAVEDYFDRLQEVLQKENRSGANTDHALWASSIFRTNEFLYVE